MKKNFSFIEGFDEDLVCHICLEPFLDPLIHTCENAFCKECLSKVKDCPTCRKPLTSGSLYENKIVMKMVNKVEVKCNYCKTKTTVGQFNSHFIKCEEIVVTCSGNDLGCIIKLKRKDMNNHEKSCKINNLKKECDELKESCNKLRGNIKILENKIIKNNNHYNENTNCLKKMMNDYTAEIKNLNDIINEKNAVINSLNDTIKEKNNDIEKKKLFNR